MSERAGKSRLHCYVSGRVQGVFYRMFAVREASVLGLSGTARNLGDGRVEVIAEGDADSLKKLLDRLRRGPPAALVKEVLPEWEPYEHEFDGFHIEYD